MPAEGNTPDSPCGVSFVLMHVGENMIKHYWSQDLGRLGSVASGIKELVLNQILYLSCLSDI